MRMLRAQCALLAAGHSVARRPFFEPHPKTLERLPTFGVFFMA